MPTQILEATQTESQHRRPPLPVFYVVDGDLTSNSVELQSRLVDPNTDVALTSWAFQFTFTQTDKTTYVIGGKNRSLEYRIIATTAGPTAWEDLASVSYDAKQS